MDGCAFHSAWPSSASRKMWGFFRPAPMALRGTPIFRKEDGVWRLVHRHADPLLGKTAPVTVLQR
jgi:ketosteroid isomerase-like protein